MVEQMEKRFTWVLKNYSSLQGERCYSRPFAVAGCNWHIVASWDGDNNDGHLSVYLELADPASLPPGWRGDVKFSLTLVNKAWGKSNIVSGERCRFDAFHTGWGFEFVSLTKLHAKDEGFLVNNKLIIVAELQVFPDIVVTEETVKVIEPLSNKEGNQADDASFSKSHGNSSCQADNVSTDNLDDVDDDDTSKMGSDDDDDTSDKATYDSGSCEDDVNNDDASSPISDDGGSDISLLNQLNALVQDSVAAETEVSFDEASFVSSDSARNGSSLDQVKSLKDASHIEVLNTVASVTESTNNLLKEIQPAKETMHINGFDVFSSQVESVSHIFKRHPDIASCFRPKNQQIRKAYMNELLSLIEMLCQSPEKLSEDDLSKAGDTLADLIDVGFKLDWLKIKLSEVSEKKKKEKSSGARLRTMEEQLQKLKLMFLDLETQMQTEKVEALAARAPLSFNDVVC